MPTRIVAPLTGTVSRGTWFANQRLNVAAMPNGFMQYNYLLPQGYSSSFVYPILFYGHPNDEGMNGGSYPADGGGLVFQTVIDGTFNTVAFRTNFPCIVVVPECDQTLDGSGANGNANFGGYADTPNSGGNEQGITALLNFFIANFSVDQTRAYATGDSLGAIGSLAWLVDNNTVNGVHKIWTAAMGFSDQLYRPNGIPNSQVFAAMATVPYIAVSTPNDNNQQIYDQAGWQFYTGNTNYPSPADYTSGGVAALKAGSSSFYYLLDPTGVPWDTYRQLNADGGKGTALYNLLFSFTSGNPQPPPPSGQNMTVLTATSGGSLTDTAGNVWTLPGGTVTENGTAVAGGAGTAALAVVGATIWGEDGGTGIWYTFAGGLWTQQTGTPAVVPNQVAGLTAGTVTNTSVPLSWTAPILATGYVVEMSTAGGAFVSIGTPTTTTFTATGLTAGTAYAFQVAGTDSTGRGAFSTPVSATTSGSSLAVPGAPTGLTAGTVTATSVALSWTAPTTGGAVSAYLIDDEVSGGSFGQVFSGTATSATISGLTPSTAYTFEALASNATGTGPASNTVTVTTLSGMTKATVQAQITTAEGLATQLSTLLATIYTNVGQL
jgi:hypothetical protein